VEEISGMQEVRRLLSIEREESPHFLAFLRMLLRG